MEDREAAILDDLRETLALDADEIGPVQGIVDQLRGDRREYLPRSDALPWWEDFADLLTQVLLEAAAQAA